jgi:hypothetical protein
MAGSGKLRRSNGSGKLRRSNGSKHVREAAEREEMQRSAARILGRRRIPPISLGDRGKRGGGMEARKKWSRRRGETGKERF